MSLERGAFSIWLKLSAYFEFAQLSSYEYA